MVKARFIAPVLNVAILIFLALSVPMLTEKIFGLTCLYIKVLKLKPKKIYKWEAIKPDLVLGSLAFPMVLVQIPMYNEKEVYKKSIGAVSASDWLIFQILDDSTDPFIKVSVFAVFDQTHCIN